MNIAVFGTGMVGQTLAGALADCGHAVMVGTRDVARALAYTEPSGFGMPGFGIWATQHPSVQVGTFAQAASFGELLINATHAESSLGALDAAGAANMRGKVLIELGNPLDSSSGQARSLANDYGSLAEKIQQAFPEVRVVKTLCTMFTSVMVNPALVPGDSTVFVGGNDAAAKAVVAEILRGFGWSDILDLGDITSARAVEMLLPLFFRNFQALGHTNFNLKVVR